MPTINEMLAAHLTIQTRVKHNENRKITCESKLESMPAKISPRIEET